MYKVDLNIRIPMEALLIPLHIAILYSNDIVLKISDKTVDKRGTVPIYDIMISNIGIPLIDYYYLPDVFIGVSIMLFLPFVTYATYIQFIKEHMTILLIRSSAILSTMGHISARYNVQKRSLGYFNAGFSDLVISGHATTMALLLCYVLDLSNMWQYSVISFILIVFGILSNILNGDHYTSDVVLGMALVYFVHY